LKGDKVAPDGQLKFPEWQAPLQELILEFDSAKLPEKVQKVETVLMDRLYKLSRNGDGHLEREAIQDALNILRVIKRERPTIPVNKK
jgi:hypothetical protein